MSWTRSTKVDPGSVVCLDKLKNQRKTRRNVQFKQGTTSRPKYNGKKFHIFFWTGVLLQHVHQRLSDEVTRS